ncbi:class I SAM-dependent DNA methyltransferase [Bradyrhizobium sp. DN5]|uniref:HsdM family class I SAM-dependent methyltransferase n=1 Tax=Bradyrhizobium sp. DN5 TaxID=3056950 RepID=UPI00352481C4
MLANDFKTETSNFLRFERLFGTSDRGFGANALFVSQGSPIIVFKDLTDTSEPVDPQIIDFQSLAWNAGLAPLVWVTTKNRIFILNGYARPCGNVEAITLEKFACGDQTALKRLESIFGRLAIDSGLFWETELGCRLDRRTKVDAALLRDLAALEEALETSGLDSFLAQKLIGRTIFAKYLADRGLLTGSTLKQVTRAPGLVEALRSPSSAWRLFRWIQKTFNGDLFPPEQKAEHKLVNAEQLELLARFLEGEQLDTGQRSLFPFRFEAIPIEVISAMYEQFAHAVAGTAAAQQSLHYTPTNLVDFLLNRAFEGITSHAKVLDPACGSGVFLVESFRRLVRLRAGKKEVTRDLVREVLYNQLFGVDINPSALQVTAFSLYLSALDMDPLAGSNWHDLKFEKLLGRSLFCCDFLTSPLFSECKFDLIVGNPPWTYGGASSRLKRKSEGRSWGPTPSRSPDWDFLWRASSICSASARIALVMKATPFFSRDATAARARSQLLLSFSNVSLINLSQLRGEHLFPSISRSSDRAGAPKRGRPNLAPALLFFGSRKNAQEDAELTVGNVSWSNTFRRHGLIQIARETIKNVPIRSANLDVGLLKAATLGNLREFEVLQSIVTRSSNVRLSAWLRSYELPADQGFQLGGGDKKPTTHLERMPALTAPDYQAPTLPTELPPFVALTAHRPRDPRIYRGPLVLCPEGCFTKALEPGRYSAAYETRDIAFNESFVGISFANSRHDVGRALAALMHSKMIAFQLAFGASNVGIKQPKIEKVDLGALCIPDLFAVPAGFVEQLDHLGGRLRDLSANPSAVLRALDDVAYRLFRIDASDQTVINDILDRSRALFLDTDTARIQTVRSVDNETLRRYVREFTDLMDRELAKFSHLRSRHVTTLRFGSHVLALRVEFAREGVKPARPKLEAKPELFEGTLFRSLGGSSIPNFHQNRYFFDLSPGMLYLLKPDEHRLWRPSDAQNDVAMLKGSGESLLQLDGFGRKLSLQSPPHSLH